MKKKIKIGNFVVDRRVPIGKIKEYCFGKNKKFYYIGFVEKINEFEGCNLFRIRWLRTELVEDYVDEQLVRLISPKELKEIDIIEK